MSNRRDPLPAAARWPALIRNVLPALAGFIVLAAAAWAVRDVLREYRYADLQLALWSLPPMRLVACLVLSTAGYCVLTGYDFLAVRYVQAHISYARTALISFVSYSIGNNVGFGNLAGSSIRYRLYSALDVGGADIARIVVFCTAGFWIGFLSLGTVVFAIEPLPIPAVLHFPLATARALAPVCAVPVVAFCAWTALQREPLLVRNVELHAPSWAVLLGQIAVGMLDWTLAGTALYVVLPADVALGWGQFLGFYLLAVLAGLLSHIPGGLGVLETLMVMFLGAHGAAPAPVLASVLVYRFCYYLVPLIAGALLLAGQEIGRRRQALAGALAPAVTGAQAVAPPILAITTFAAGVILLFSGAAPPTDARLGWIADLLPLAVIEASHFGASLAGTLLLLLAHGLLRRLDAAYRLTVVALSFSITTSLLAGAHFEQAFALLLLLGSLLLARERFYRRSALLNEPLTGAWAAAATLALLGSIALGFFAYADVEYEHELWWQFAVDAHAPRWMRASIGASTLAVMFAVMRMLRPARARPGAPDQNDFARARAILSGVAETGGNLAFLGDKSLLFNDTGTAFLMYAVRGRSWVAVGDPVGPENEWSDLLWDFSEMADVWAGRTVFYEVTSRRLDLYLDLGMSLFKLGEEARVDLASFELEGKHNAELRRVRRSLERAGWSFRVLSLDETRARMAELRSVSDAWLGEKTTAEKGFSLGFFEESYVAATPCAVVERDGRIAAFANLWLGGNGHELTVDLMRYNEEVPNGIMDYLFTSLFLWSKGSGYRWFNLGMAPLAGLDEFNPSSLWSRLGRFVFRHGENFYNFEGLRRYKAKFDPVWLPRYVACPSAWALPQALADVTALVSGGLRRALAK
ncbi:MAG: bifunctional lysylphosphatidylglycerol flippase/synthetase MprF [Deltaproteobacteria bacterium]|nr:bifunctional lysylphosphatidylglycerol flippase/synthetase MprF [Deltaproteobacteria bacterium]